MANKITYGDKTGIQPKTIHVNQWWDSDANEVKNKHNLNDDRITNLEENQYSGLVVYSTLAELPGTGTSLVSYKVSNDPTPSNNGYYHWNGSIYVKDASLATGIVESGNVEPLSGDEAYKVDFANFSHECAAYNSAWIPQGFARVGDATPAFTLNHAYKPLSAGTIFGQTIPTDFGKYVLIGDGSTGYSVETLRDKEYGIFEGDYNHYINSDGIRVSFSGLMNIEIPYTSGDSISVNNAKSGVLYDSYNFYNGTSWISSANNLDSIPETTTSIKANSSMTTPASAIINNKLFNVAGLVVSNKSAIADEITNRANADTTLQADINNEASTARAAEQANAENIIINSNNAMLNFTNIKFYANKYIRNSDGFASTFTGLCYCEIPYSEGDDLLIEDAKNGGTYNKYNFFNGETWISSSDSYDSIPASTTIIKVNGSILSNIIPYIRINGIMQGLWSVSKFAHDKFTLNGRNIHSLGDSLATGGVWQQRIADLSDANFDNSQNNSLPLSAGGTITGGVNTTCGQWRARNLNGLFPTHVIIENINDCNYALNHSGSIADIPFMLSNILTYGSTFPDYATAVAAKATVIASFTAGRVIGSGIRVPYYSSTVKNLQITGIATSNGDIILTVGGNVYNISVLITDSISEIINKILEVSYTDYTDTINGTDSVDFQTNGTATILFNENGTGVNASVTDGGTVTAYIEYCFNSKDVTTWDTDSNWVVASNMSLYSFYKGLIEYLQETYTSTKFYWLIPTRLPIAWDSGHPNYDPSMWYEDGSINSFGWYSNDQYLKYKALTDIQKDICQKYGIEILDMEEHSGITQSNVQAFYPEFNVHPFDSAYERWGETCFKLIK